MTSNTPTQTTQAILQKYRATISNVLAESSKEMPAEVKQRAVLELLQDALAATGKVFLVGGLPAHVDHDGRITRLLPGTPDLDRFLDACGFLPGATDWDKILFRKLQSRLDIPPNFVHSIAHFDPKASILYLNEWAGTMLRIGPDGICSRHTVGTFDVLFDVAEEPHEPVDLDKINAIRGPALAWTDDSPLVKFIFSIGKFSETSGIGKENCVTVLLVFVIAILFSERVMVIPVVHLHGLPGSKKTSLAVGVGWLLSGLGLGFSATACPESVSDVETCLINARGLLVLDEANSDYVPSRNAFWGGPLSVTNVDFTYWARMPFELPGGSDYRSILIIDECHNLEEKLCELGKVQITRRQLQKVGMPQDSFGYVGKDHAAAHRFVEDFLGHVRTALDQERFVGKEKRMFVRKFTSLQLTLEVGDWIHWHEKDLETGREALVLKPMNGYVAAGRLFERAEKLLFMSATVGKVEQFLAGLNLRESDASWHYADSEFPVEKRLVQLFTGAYLSSKNEDRALPPIIDGCRQVLDHFPDYKGAILVPSYTLASKLAAHLGPRILTHTPDNKDKVIARHCQSPEPTVLLGVCLHEGLDLKDDSARFLILPKVLYPFLGDPYIKERSRRDPDWYLRQTILAMVQAAGRVVRSPTDHAEIAILDSCFANLLLRPDMFPRWFWEAIRVNGKKPPQRVPAAPAPEMEGS